MAGGGTSLVFDILRKAASFALAVMLLLTVIFVTFNVMPGDPLLVFIPKSPGFGDELYEKIIDEMRLEEPLYVQFADYIIDTLTGDFRVSSSTLRGADIQDFIWDRAGNTLTLLSLGLLGSFIFGTAFERLAIGGRGKIRPLLIHGLSLALLFIPAFSLALFMLMANVELGLGLPLRGDGTLYVGGQDVDPASVLESAVLPVLTVVLSSIGLLVLFLREGIYRSGRNIVRRDSRLASLASGLVRVKPLVHFHVAWTMCVVIVVDIAFSYGGLGHTLWDAMDSRDFPVLMAVSFVIPMMAMAAASVVSGSIHPLSGRPLREVLNDWGRRDAVQPLRTSVTSSQGAYSKDWTSAAWQSFRHLRVGMFALVMLVILMVVGALAPLLAPSYPLEITTDRNQGPSGDHLLGTDILGRDVFSMWLLALRDAVLVMLALMVGCLAIGLLIGFIATETISKDGLLERVADFFLTPVARVAVVTPLLVVVVVRTIVLGGSELNILASLAAFYAWAWLVIVRPIRAHMRTSDRGEGPRRMMAPALVAESLSAAKFAVPLIIATRFSLAAVGLGVPGSLDFGSMVETSFQYSAFITGDWHLILPPLAGMVLVCATSFVFLDRAEHAARSAKPHPSPQSSD